jgi:cell division protein FtsN
MSTNKKTKIDLADQFQLKPQQLNAVLKELEIPHRQTYDGEELEKIETKLAASRQTTDADGDPKLQSPFDQVIGEMHQQTQTTGHPTETAAALKQQAQQAAADLTIAGNVLTAYYVQTGNFEDPELANQVKASAAFLGQALSNTSGIYCLGKLLASANLEAFNQLPAVQAESHKLLNSRTP